MLSSDVSIKVDGVSKHYDMFDSPYGQLKFLLFGDKNDSVRKFQALNNVSFEVKKGEPFGIIGRNGSGKSTLLQIITGTISPSSGSVTTSGRIGALLELGSGFNPEFTGRENVYLNGLLLGMSRDQIDERFDKIAGFADIGAHLDQPVKTYSSGMLVRLAFSVQVQLEPDILIIDEALAVGDALFQRRCYERIERLLADGITLLLVSHDQESIRTLTRNSILLHQGKPLFLGNSSESILK
jgi:lipopolysaccharide transport system ATP-binding protein